MLQAKAVDQVFHALSCMIRYPTEEMMAAQVLAHHYLAAEGLPKVAFHLLNTLVWQPADVDLLLDSLSSQYFAQESSMCMNPEKLSYGISILSHNV